MTFTELNVYGKPSERIRARSDVQSDLSFIQREIDGQKQQLSSDRVALHRYRAEQIRQTSDALRQGCVVSRQGRWNAAAHIVLTCEGQTVEPNLDSRALTRIERRQSHSSVAASITWLEAPEDFQLPLVANENSCIWQPTEKGFQRLPVVHAPMTTVVIAAAVVSHSCATGNARLSQGDIKLHPLLIQLLA